MKYLREATVDEIIAAHPLMKYGRKEMFRHFMIEKLSGNSKSGVAHQDHSRAKLQLIDGALFVQHHGKLVEVTASWYEIVPGMERVMDLRVKSEYLKAHLA